MVLWIYVAVSLPNNVAANSALLIVSLALIPWAVVAMVLSQIAYGSSPSTIVVFSIVAILVPLLAMIACVSQGSTILRLAGAKVGFVGVSKSEKAKITPGHCRGCGYDRAGLELLQECPECQRVPQVI
jgi:succinate-acetate transporter protein